MLRCLVRGMVALVLVPSISAQNQAFQYFPSEGNLNALVILVQFQDDRFEHCVRLEGHDPDGRPIFETVEYTPHCAERDRATDPWQVGNYQSWTDDPTTEWPLARDSIDSRRSELPEWAKNSGLIDAPGKRTITEGSLTDFYSTMSGGKFDFRGYVWPYTYRPEHNQDVYLNDPDDFVNGVVRLSHEIVTYVARNPEGIPLGVPGIWDRFTNGDANNPVPDGIFDCILLVYRFNGFKEIVGGSGISSFGTSSRSDSFAAKPVFIGDLRVTGGFPAGTGIVNRALTKKDAVKMITHEIGHRHFGPHVNSLYDVMGIGPYNFFGARNRLALDWAREREINLEDIQKSGGKIRVFLREEPTSNVIRVKNGEKTCGDLIIEARTWSNYWDRPSDGNNGDGDFGDPSIPTEGLFLHKANGIPCRGVPHFSSLENTGLEAHNKASFLEGNIGSLSSLAFGPGDTYTPFTPVRFHFLRNRDLDERVAITDIRREENGFSFDLWSDFTQTHWMISKNPGSNYAFHAQTVARNERKGWNLNGTFILEEGLELPSGTSLKFGRFGRVNVPVGRMVHIGCDDGSAIEFTSKSTLLSWLRIKRAISGLCMESAGTITNGEE